MPSMVTPTAIDIFPDSIQSALREIEKAMNMNVMTRFNDKGASNMHVMANLFLARFKAFGFTNKANGSFRVAFIHGTEPWVIKMAVRHVPTDSGYNDNLREAFVYANIEEKWKKYLPETFLWKNAVLIQKKYLPDLSLHRNHSKEIEKIGMEIGVGDMHGNNIGFHTDGSFRFIDFQPSLGHYWSAEKPMGKLYNAYTKLQENL